MEYTLILSAVSSQAEAESIAKALVKEKLAACVNILPNVTSVYTWNNEMNTESEILLFIKTTESQSKKVENRIIDLHSYDTPEIIFLPIQGGSKQYLDWINESV